MNNEKEQLMTYAEYAKWEDTWELKRRCEVLNGQIISTPTSLSPLHQDTLGHLSVEFLTYLRNKESEEKYKVLSHIDLFLSEDINKQWVEQKVTSWLIPDLIILKESQIRQNKVLGAPPLVAEVLSPSTAKLDRLTKFAAYQRAGVKEYWIVDPANQLIEQYVLKGETYKLQDVCTKEESIKVYTLGDLIINLINVFP